MKKTLTNKPGNQMSIGECPECGASVLANEAMFRCINNDGQRCRFRIYRNSLAKFQRGIITLDEMKDLLAGSVIPLIGMISVKTGEPFHCVGRLKFDHTYDRWSIKFIFGHARLDEFLRELYRQETEQWDGA